MAALTGRLICADAGQVMTALSLLPGHVDLSRAEPGCLRFDAWQDDDPLIWHISELFIDEDAFEAHQSRNRASEWGRESTAIARDFQRHEVQPLIRPASASDNTAIEALHRATGAQSDLHPSLVVSAAGTIIGHFPLGQSDARPVIHPKAQALGIDTAILKVTGAQPA
ncbi:antibiotic biosynthesis monooxygenase [Paracoccus caeni]|uniref:Antibiotic biosynthesis monooxygenase n=2 Tax=Paracoccus caeni TaxID=657651 RepID=A0A934SL02_9RHOB|nr:antibiotic biosynthesis monooxygenase [Paracoccus caeni]